MTRRRRCRKVICVKNPALWNTAGGVTTFVGIRFVRIGIAVLDGLTESCSLYEQSLEGDGGVFPGLTAVFTLSPKLWNLQSGPARLCALEQLELQVVSCVPDVLSRSLEQLRSSLRIRRLLKLRINFVNALPGHCFSFLSRVPPLYSFKQNSGYTTTTCSGGTASEVTCG